MSARLGLSVPLDEPLTELPALARRAESLGYTDAWSMESNGLDAFTPLAAVAVATERMRLGTAIVPAWTRPAGLLAMQAAAMAELAPDRFVLGLGSSTPVVVERWLGVPFSRPLTRTREAAAGVRTLLEGGRLGALKLLRPPARPVPIYLAALGPRMLRAAGEVGEGVIFFLCGPRIIPELLTQVGREVESVARLVVIPGRGPAAMAAARRHLVTYALVPYYARSLARQGFGEEVAAITAAWNAGDRGAATAVVSDAMVQELLLTGTDGDIRDRLAAYRRAGLETPVLALSPVEEAAGARAAEVRRLLEALAPARA